MAHILPYFIRSIRVSVELKFTISRTMLLIVIVYGLSTMDSMEHMYRVQVFGKNRELNEFNSECMLSQCSQSDTCIQIIIAHVRMRLKPKRLMNSKKGVCVASAILYRMQNEHQSPNAHILLLQTINSML